MSIIWQDAVLICIRELCEKERSAEFTRQNLMDKKLAKIINMTQTKGKTPDCTLSYCLQRLRDKGYISFVDNNGTYLLNVGKNNEPLKTKIWPCFEKEKIPVFCADVGSIKQDNFGWFGLLPSQSPSGIEISGSDIRDFTEALVEALKRFGKISIGFECPLFIPLPDDPNALTSSRPGEEGKPWSSGAGTIVLAMGLNQSTWIFEKIRREVDRPIKPTFQWNELVKGDKNLHVWEAFVTGKEKAETNKGDAALAVKWFLESLPDLEVADAINMGETEVFSLAGAALLRSGLGKDIEILKEKCVVIKPKWNTLKKNS